jgi:hypothetical protein
MPIYVNNRYGQTPFVASSTKLGFTQTPIAPTAAIVDTIHNLLIPLGI